MEGKMYNHFPNKKWVQKYRSFSHEIERCTEQIAHLIEFKHSAAASMIDDLCAKRSAAVDAQTDLVFEEVSAWFGEDSMDVFAGCGVQAEGRIIQIWKEEF